MCLYFSLILYNPRNETGKECRQRGKRKGRNEKGETKRAKRKGGAYHAGCPAWLHRGGSPEYCPQHHVLRSGVDGVLADQVRDGGHAAAEEHVSGARQVQVRSRALLRGRH